MLIQVPLWIIWEILADVMNETDGFHNELGKPAPDLIKWN